MAGGLLNEFRCGGTGLTGKKLPSDDDRRACKQEPLSWTHEAPMGEALRNTYRDILDEPVPAPLQKLIEKLREKERGGKS